METISTTFKKIEEKNLKEISDKNNEILQHEKFIKENYESAEKYIDILNDKNQN